MLMLLNIMYFLRTTLFTRCFYIFFQILVNYFNKKTLQLLLLQTIPCPYQQIVDNSKNPITFYLRYQNFSQNKVYQQCKNPAVFNIKVIYLRGTKPFFLPNRSTMPTQPSVPAVRIKLPIYVQIDIRTIQSMHRTVCRGVQLPCRYVHGRRW